jgi:Leucine-rich repeat (LRR) protein
VFVQVETITCANNKIKQLHAFASLHQFLPNVVNLSLENNAISEFNQLDNLKSLPLRELILSGNPIANKENYRVYVFPLRAFNLLRAHSLTHSLTHSHFSFPV